ncbi:MAG: hypothetical protein ABIZ09_05935 [Rhodoferax sp.]|jgi:hypothetical protein
MKFKTLKEFLSLGKMKILAEPLFMSRYPQRQLDELVSGRAKS